MQVDCEWSLRPEVGKKVSFTVTCLPEASCGLCSQKLGQRGRSWTKVYLDDKGAGAKDVMPLEAGLVCVWRGYKCCGVHVVCVCVYGLG